MRKSFRAPRADESDDVFQRKNGVFLEGGDHSVRRVQHNLSQIAFDNFVKRPSQGH